jgi:hypothetical protein
MSGHLGGHWARLQAEKITAVIVWATRSSARVRSKALRSRT